MIEAFHKEPQSLCGCTNTPWCVQPYTHWWETSVLGTGWEREALKIGPNQSFVFLDHRKISVHEHFKRIESNATLFLTDGTHGSDSTGPLSCFVPNEQKPQNRNSELNHQFCCFHSLIFDKPSLCSIL